MLQQSNCIGCIFRMLQQSNLREQEQEIETKRHRGSRSSVRFGSTLVRAMNPIDCSLLIFGLTVSSVLDNACEQRDLDVVELWSGVGAIASAAEAAGFAAMAFDKFRIRGVTDIDDPDTTEDILLEAGFRRALSLVLRLRPGGLLWMAPVCSSWIFLNLRCTMRTRAGGPKFRGDLRYLPVRHGNLMAEMAAFLFLVAVSRGVHAVIENPACSMMFKYEVFANACCLWSPRFWAVLPHCRHSTAPYGSRFGKKFKLMGSHAWVLQLACKCLCPGRVHKRLTTEKSVGGKRAVTGLKQALKDSAAYPAKMGIAVIHHWSRGRSSGPRSGSSGPRSGNTARSAGPKPKAHGSKRRSAAGHGATKQSKKTWTALDLGESLEGSSSSSRAPEKQRPCWQSLDLDDAVDPGDRQGDISAGDSVAPAGVNFPAARTARTWRSLDFDESDEPPKSQQSCRWHNLGLHE